MKKIGKNKILFFVLAIACMIAMVGGTIVYNLSKKQDEVTLSTTNLEKGDKFLYYINYGGHDYRLNGWLCNFTVYSNYGTLKDGYCLWRGRPFPNQSLSERCSMYNISPYYRPWDYTPWIRMVFG